MAAIDIHPVQRIIISALLFFFFLGLLINIPGCCAAQDILYSGQSLDSGESLQYGTFNLIMQQDCNLVLYQNSSKLWESDTAGTGQNCYCYLQYNGQLIMKEPGNDQIIWNTFNYGFRDNYALTLQENGNLLIYGPVMATLS